MIIALDLKYVFCFNFWSPCWSSVKVIFQSGWWAHSALINEVCLEKIYTCVSKCLIFLTCVVTCHNHNTWRRGIMASHLIIFNGDVANWFRICFRLFCQLLSSGENPYMKYIGDIFLSPIQTWHHAPPTWHFTVWETNISDLSFLSFINSDNQFCCLIL